MDEKINQILADLYGLEPEFKKHEQVLLSLIEQMLQEKPTIKLDQKFVNVLRAQILEQAAEMQEKQEKLNFNFMKKFVYVMAGAAICAVLVVPSLLLTKKQQAGIDLNFKSQVARIQDNAFGTINLTTGGEMVMEKTTTVTEPTQAQGFGGGGGNVTTVTIDGRGAGNGVMMPAPGLINYKYVYQGDEFEFKTEQLDVYKRAIGMADSQSLTSLLKSFNFGLLDLNKFSALKTQNLTLAEDKDFGMLMNIDFSNASVAIYENWPKWEKFNPTASCRDEKCFERNRLKESDLLGDEELIKISNQFLTEHNIKLDGYGLPIVKQEWRLMYERTEDKSLAWIPEVMQVIYPLLVDGQTVYSQNGTEVGVGVNINLRFKKVTGVFDLKAQNFISSAYKVNQNWNEILSQAENGGLYNYQHPEAIETKELFLEKPELALVQVWNYKQGVSEELLLPALIFKVKQAPNDGYARQQIIVPVIDGLIDEPGGPVYILEGELGA